MIEELHKDYQGLQAQLGLPPLERMYVLVERQTLTIADVEAEVARLETSQGWLRRQSNVRRTPSGQKAAAQDYGLPLSGEWRLSENESKHLRQDGKGGWLLYRYRQFASQDEAEQARRKGGDVGTVHVCLAEKTVLLSADEGGKLAYHVYWGGDGANIRRLFARFLGFEPDAQQQGEQ
jgi:hypothetical protein